MKTKLSVSLGAALSAAIIIVTGCASSRVEENMPSTETQVSLDRANYKVIKAGAEGRSYGFRFLLGIIPITAPSAADARADLYQNLGQPVNDKSVALVNVMEDRSTTWLILFSIPKLVITGDVVEFNRDDNSQGQPARPAAPQ
jgi:hypothetical protein